MNFYPRHIGDYLKDTAHLSLLEHGVYGRLLDVYYTREVGIEEADAARLVGARSKEERTALGQVLGEFFVLQAGVWTHRRCDAEIERFHKKAEHNREVGKLGGRPRKSETQPEPKNNPVGFLGAGNQKPNPNPPSSQEPIASSVPIGTGAGAPATEVEVIFGLGVPLLTANGVADKQARTMLGLMRKTHGDPAVIDALKRCAHEAPIEPVAWLQAVLSPKSPQRKSDALMAGNIAAAQRFMENAQ